MMFHHARRAARVATDGSVVLLEDQDRAGWDAAMIAEASELLETALRRERHGPFVLQAAIAGLHARAPTADATDWPMIVALYDQLIRLEPSPVAELNRAVAVAMVDGPDGADHRSPRCERCPRPLPPISPQRRTQSCCGGSTTAPTPLMRTAPRSRS